MVDDETLTMNVLQFAGKNFDYEATVTVGGTEYAIFSRTETETEAKLRPELVRLRVVFPREWVHYEEAFDTLVLLAGTGTGGPERRRAPGTTMLEPEEFRDQGVDWRRITLPARHSLYLPKGEESRLLSPEGRTALGVPG